MPGPHHGLACLLVKRHVWGATQVILGQARRGQDLADAGDVEILPGVARGGECEQFAVQLQSAAEHRGSLQGLVG